jgi:hypothetical protein
MPCPAIQVLEQQSKSACVYRGRTRNQSARLLIIGAARRQYARWLAAEIGLEMERLRACGAAGLRQGEIRNRGRRCTGNNLVRKTVTKPEASRRACSLWCLVSLCFGKQIGVQLGPGKS